jgi:hypothetical protein
MTTRKHSIRTHIQKCFMFLIIYVSSLFNLPLVVAAETLVEHPVTQDFQKAANKRAGNKAVSPFLQAA